jgi:integrase
MYACKKLWKEFIENERVEVNAFELEDLPQEDNSYDALTTKEIDLFFDYCLTLKHKPRTQNLYFRFLYVVACRKTTAQTIKWENIIREPDDDGNEFWVVKFHEKGEDYKRAITDEFYNELKENYEKNKEFSGKVFNVNNKTYDNTIKGFCEEYNITKHIVQHSIRSTASDNIQNILGDINTTAKGLGHKNIQTTYRRYMNKNNDYSSQPSYMLHKDFSIDKLKGLSKDELLVTVLNYTM